MKGMVCVIHTKKMLFITMLSVSASMLSLNLSPANANEVSFQDVSADFWGNANIQWAVHNHIVDGYPDGTFKPDHMVEQAEFLAMLFRAFPQTDLEQGNETGNWATPYMQYAREMGYQVVAPSSLQGHTNPVFLTRGMVAQYLTNASGKKYSMDDSIQYLLDIGLADGKTDNSIEGFQKRDEVTRAEAVTFIQRLKQSSEGLQPCPSTEETYIPDPSAAAAREQANKEKVSMRNLQNGGRLAVGGDWIFMNPSDKSPSLSKWSKDGSTKIKLSDDNAQSINAVEDWLFYTVQGNSGIYKMRQDGTERTKLASVPASNIVVNQNWIYYLNADQSKISRMKLDGTGNEDVLSEIGINQFFIHENQIYFMNTGKELFRAQLNGAEKQKIEENVTNGLAIEDGWIYYGKSENVTTNIYRKSIDGTTTILLMSVDPMRDNGPLYGSIQYRDGFLYFLHGKISLSSHIDIEKIRIDGTGRTLVANAGYATELYDAGSFFYTWNIVPGNTERFISRSN